MALLIQLIANGLVNGVLFALLACGFGLVYRSTRVFHVAFAGLFLLSAYAALVFQSRLHWPLGLAFFAGTMIGGAGGWLMELALYRPFRAKGASSGAVLVASLGLFIIIENSIVLGFGDEIQNFSLALSSTVRLGSVLLTSTQLIQAGVGSAVLVVFLVAAARLKSFKIMRAMSDEPELLPILGLPEEKYRTAVFVLSGIFGGLSGCLITMDVGLDPHTGMSYLLISAVAVLVGGVDRIVGWISGGFLLAVLQGVFVWKFSFRWLDLVVFATLIIVLMFRPQGIFGLRRRLEEM